jgi:ribosomal-protein-alanine N-acetyltransferase
MDTQELFKPFPQCESERLLLREINHSDEKDLFRFLSDDEVMKRTDLKTQSTIHDTEKFVKYVNKGCRKEKSIWWGITTKDSNVIIGIVGFPNWIKKQFRSEVGAVLAKEYWSQGIMTEAMDAVIRFGFTAMKLNRIEATLMPHNMSSMKFLKKLGFQEEGILREYRFFKGQFHDVKMVSLLKKDFPGFSTGLPKP